MKKVLKTTLAVLLVAALIAAFAVGLAACNDKGEQGSDFDSVFYDASAASEKGGGSGTLGSTSCPRIRSARIWRRGTETSSSCPPTPASTSS